MGKLLNITINPSEQHLIYMKIANIETKKKPETLNNSMF